LGVNQCVVGSTHKAGHTLDLILSFGVNITDIVIIPQSEAISDHSLISFCVRHSSIVHTEPRYRFSRTITPATAQSFINHLPELSTSIGSPSDPLELEQATEFLESTFRCTLDNVAPIKDKKLAPWYSDHTRSLKQNARKLERKWHQTKLLAFKIAWKDSILTYKKALRLARSTYLSTLIENNKSNPKFLFNTIAELTRNKTSTEISIITANKSNDFMKFFDSKIKNIRQKIQAQSPNYKIDWEDRLTIDQSLESFTPLEENDLISLISSAKSSTCL
ncbi:hypothetical protein PGIGA_G00233490, partial [Pangasianodon gigas]|nr:hypothetical protein [Pangasianodon gigas]